MLELNFTPFPLLKTARLLLRRMELSDARANFLLRSNESVNKYLDGFKHDSIEQTLAFIQKIQKGIDNNEWIFWVIALQGKFIGTICLWNIHAKEEKAETGYTLHPDFQGKGYMREALEKVLEYGFSAIGLKTIEAWTHRDNQSSARLLTATGFTLDVNRKVEDGSSNVVFTRDK